MRRVGAFLLLLFPALAPAGFGPHAVPVAHEAIVHKRIAEGEYVEYLPRRAPVGILVLAHGSVDEERSESSVSRLAEGFVRRWTGFADDHRLIVVAPVFDHAYGSWIGEPGVAL